MDFRFLSRKHAQKKLGFFCCSNASFKKLTKQIRLYMATARAKLVPKISRDGLILQPKNEQLSQIQRIFAV